MSALPPKETLTECGLAMWSRLLAVALLLLPNPALADVKEKVAALAPSGVVLVVDLEGSELVAQNVDEPFVPASVTKIVTAWLAGAGRGLPLRDPLLSRRQACALRARRRRSFSDLRRASAARDRSGRSSWQEADRGHRARREPLPFKSPHPGHRGHQQCLRCAQLRA